MTEKVGAVVVGAGVVGLACAAHLQRRGHAVTLVDPEPPGSQCSSGNAGMLSRASCVPVGLPGTAHKVPGWLLDPAGPLVIRPSYLPAIAPWLWRFWRSTSLPRVQQIASALHVLLDPTVVKWRVLADWAGVPDLVRQEGYAIAYRSAQAFAGDELGRRLRRERGVRIDVLEGRAVREFDPALSPAITHLAVLPEQGHVANPLRLSQALAARLEAGGARFVRARVRGFDVVDGRVRRVLTDADPVETAAVVVAAGARSKPLAAGLGANVPLETERGYHVMLGRPTVLPRIPVCDGGAKWFTTPMEDGLRVAGTVELAGLDAAPDWRRADHMLEGIRRLLPGLAFDTVERWMGHRPSLPDSLPVIGRAPRASNAFFAFGHGHVGLSGGAPTGEIIAALVAGERPHVDPAPYDAARFA